MAKIYQHLTTQERAVVMTMRADLCSTRSIAKRLCRSASTISHELKRTSGSGVYDANLAHAQCHARRLLPWNRQSKLGRLSNTDKTTGRIDRRLESVVSSQTNHSFKDGSLADAATSGVASPPRTRIVAEFDFAELDDGAALTHAQMPASLVLTARTERCLAVALAAARQVDGGHARGATVDAQYQYQWL